MASKVGSTNCVNLSNLSPENRIIGGKYSLLKTIGSGSFGEVFEAINTQEGKNVAVKIEPLNVKIPLLHYEAKVYEQIGQHIGLPIVYHYGREKHFNALVIELLGPSLEDLFNLCKRRFSLKTVLMLSDQLLTRIECVHQHSFIHRDIKPDNFLIGLGRNCNKLYLIDFGLAKRFQDPGTCQHIPYREGRSLTGTARYASINSQRGFEQSRRDDLESLSYCIMYFNLGKLPWQGIVSFSKQQKYEKILEIKRSLSIDEICKSWPIEFALFMKYARNLRFQDQPDYVYLRQLFRLLFRTLEYHFDHMYDWNYLHERQMEHERDRERERERERVREREHDGERERKSDRERDRGRERDRERERERDRERDRDRESDRERDRERVREREREPMRERAVTSALDRWKQHRRIHIGDSFTFKPSDDKPSK